MGTNMDGRFLRRSHGAITLAALAFSLLGVADEAKADCGTVPFAISQPIVERFVMRPPTLLQDFRDGGEAMENRVTLVASSSRAALRPLLSVLRQANPRQRDAIAAGLAGAARNCERTRRASSRHIEQTVRASGDAALIRAFSGQYRSAGTPPPAVPKLPPRRAADPGDSMLMPGIRPATGSSGVRPVGPVR